MKNMKNWVEDCISDPQSFFNELYNNYRKSCCLWLESNYSINTSDSIDIFQQSILILYDNIQQKKVSFDNSSSVKTYLYGVAKNIALSKIRDIKKWSKVNDSENIFNLVFDNQTENKEILEDKKETILKLSAALNDLGEACKTLLTLFYYHSLSMKEIAIKLKYSDSNSAKAQKYKCLKRLKKSLDPTK